MEFQNGRDIPAALPLPREIVCSSEKQASSTTGRRTASPPVGHEPLSNPSTTQPIARMKTTQTNAAFHQASAVPYGIAVAVIRSKSAPKIAALRSVAIRSPVHRACLTRVILANRKRTAAGRRATVCRAERGSLRTVAVITDPRSEARCVVQRWERPTR